MHTQHSEKSRRLAIELLQHAPGVTHCQTMAESEWAQKGGSFPDAVRALYGCAPDYAREPQQRFLDVVAEGLETLTALSPYDPAESTQRRAEHAARYELHKRTLDELACILHGWPEGEETRRTYTLDDLKARARIFYARSLEFAGVGRFWRALLVLDRWTRKTKGNGHETRSLAHENPEIVAACELFTPGEACRTIRGESEHAVRVMAADYLVSQDPTLAEGLES